MYSERVFYGGCFFKPTGSGNALVPAAGRTVVLQPPYSPTANSVTLPDARSLRPGGPVLRLVNPSGTTVAVVDHSGGSVGNVPASTVADLLLVRNDSASGKWVLVPRTLGGGSSPVIGTGGTRAHPLGYRPPVGTPDLSALTDPCEGSPAPTTGCRSDGSKLLRVVFAGPVDNGINGVAWCTLSSGEGSPPVWSGSFGIYSVSVACDAPGPGPSTTWSVTIGTSGGETSCSATFTWSTTTVPVGPPRGNYPFASSGCTGGAGFIDNKTSCWVY